MSIIKSKESNKQDKQPAMPQQKLHINLTKNGLHINDEFIENLSIDILAEKFGEYRKVLRKQPDGTVSKDDLEEIYIWDNMGVKSFVSKGRISELDIRICEDKEWEKKVNFSFFDVNPKQVFPGIFTINGKNILEAIPQKTLREAYIFLEMKVGNWKINCSLSSKLSSVLGAISFQERLRKSKTDEIADLVRAEPEPIRDISFWYKPPRVSSGKWELPKVKGEALTFTNFNFKLAVIQELMYKQELLKPKFDVYDFCNDYAKKEIDPDDYYDKMIPEVKSWFQQLEIPVELAPKVTQLFLDGGNEINMQLIPQWDGENDLFDIKSISDEELAQFPNLKLIDGTAIYISEKAKKKLIKKGINIAE